jgi:nitrous oxide reductase accessory protein NosL
MSDTRILGYIVLREQTNGGMGYLWTERSVKWFSMKEKAAKYALRKGGTIYGLNSRHEFVPESNEEPAPA